MSFAGILTGVVQDGGGHIIVGGKIIRVPPWGPIIDVLHTVAALDAVRAIAHPSGVAVRRSVLAALAEIAKDSIEQLRS